jgi:hypothetical protein
MAASVRACAGLRLQAFMGSGTTVDVQTLPAQGQLLNASCAPLLHAHPTAQLTSTRVATLQSDEVPGVQPFPHPIMSYTEQVYKQVFGPRFSLRQNGEHKQTAHCSAPAAPLPLQHHFCSCLLSIGGDCAQRQLP